MMQLRVKLTKTEDVSFDEKSPNIPVGSQRTGTLEHPITIGKPLMMRRGPTSWFITSHVIAFDEKTSLVQTENSIYKLEFVND